MMLKSGTLIFCLLLGSRVLAQDSLVMPFAPHIRRGLTRDPGALAKALTAGRNTDKEKFEALFAWVATNIRYNYRKYDSGKSNSMDTPVKKILRRRSGICTSQAFLMDTLCDLVGIQNTTVTGYVKEVIFDVNDSMYVDNHAWNAVKLDGYWYLYDVTWSSGGRVYDYTDRGKWRRNWIEWLANRAKPGTMTLRSGKRKNKFCGIPDTRITQTKDVFYLRFVPRVLIRILSFFPFAIVEKENYVVNPNYYLTDPDVFAIDHFPNDPIWSLTNRISNVTEFSADSSYYYVTDSIYQDMERLGQFCLTCEDALYMEPLTKEKYQLKKSKKNNPNNHLFPANSNFRIAQLYFKQVLEEEDSLTKMAFIDTTLSFIEESRTELRQTKKESNLETRFHVAKNRAKRNEHLKENKQHMRLARNAWKGSRKRHIKIKSLIPKSRTYDRRYKQDVRKLKKTIFKSLNSRQLSEKREISLTNKFNSSKAKSDSLTDLISVLQDSLLDHTTTLWTNLLEELDTLWPLMSSFRQDSYLRIGQSLDNYDKEIRDIRKVILAKEAAFISTVEKKILLLADKTYAEYILLNRLIKRRNIVNNQAAKTLRSLESGGAVSRDTVIHFLDTRSDVMTNDACWSIDNANLFYSLDLNFKHFYKQSRGYFRLIANNDYLERSRYTRIYRHIYRNKKRLYHAAEGNLKLNSNLKKRLYQHRNAYLKELRKQLKKERKKSSE